MYEERKAEHARAAEVADVMGVRSYFEEHIEDAVWYLDGYVYATPKRAVAVLEALKDAKVEVDIADVPDDRDLIAALEAVEWARQIEVE